MQKNLYLFYIFIELSPPESNLFEHTHLLPKSTQPIGQTGIGGTRWFVESLASHSVFEQKKFT